MLCKVKINSKHITKYSQAIQWINLKRNVCQKIVNNLSQKIHCVENHKQPILNFY